MRLTCLNNYVTLFYFQAKFIFKKNVISGQ